VGSATESDAQSGSRRRQGATLDKRKVDADVFATELAEYRRAVAAAGIKKSELL
jgi:hypothetical protein